ncbi:TonB-dependent receptor [Dyadobacter jiangsuensis]|uniref:Iron complex outermembrane receptor protein n=1 Tax=Dyadobacter jiangsuensis TaxID=1591085 RepID=A0A2P8GBC0_9BACT|nr:TonB-dependent receptor [Dyadobacter jiangsuensis]PSL31195.1 iron complex outermembrane receptor protein [Dyadobacter jiangsuensis]
MKHLRRRSLLLRAWLPLPALLTASLLFLGHIAFGQQSVLDKKVSLHYQQTSLSSILESIEKQTGCSFSYSADQLDTRKRYSIDAEGKTLGAVLEELLGTTARAMKVRGEQIMIQSLPKTGKGSVKGKVQTPDGKPVEFASVVIKGTGKGAQTDENGFFTITDVPEGAHSLLVEHMGFSSAEQPFTVRANEQTALQTVTMQEGDKNLAEVVVSAGRVRESLNSVPASIAVLKAKEIQEQATINNSIAAILGNTIPGLGMPNNKATNTGQTLRGRSLLVLVDGIPQSTPLMNGNRDIRSIDPAVLERVEVVKGATAIYGNGAGGGLINYITRKPTENKAIGGITQLGTHGNVFHMADTPGYRISQMLQGKINKFSYVVSGLLDRTGVYKDGEGDVISTSNGLGETRLYNAYTKLFYDFNARNELEFSFNLFSSRQYTKYVNKAGVYGETPTIAVPGESPGDAEGTPFNYNLSLRYLRRELWGKTSMDVTAYMNGFESMNAYTASTTGWYGPGQTQITSRKKGLRANFYTPFNVNPNFGGGVTYGIDILGDVTNQVLTDGRVYVPDMNMTSIAPYVQVKLDIVKDLTLKTGARFENIGIDVNDYSTLAKGPNGEGAVAVKGGKLDYKALNMNAGVRYSKYSLFNPFFNFSQAFGISELGRILRSATTNTIANLNTKPIIVNNYEAGFSSQYKFVQFTAAYFISTSKLGADMVTVNGVMTPLRLPEEIKGYEFTLDFQPTDKLSFGGSYSYVEGKADQNDNGHFDDAEDRYLTGARITPPKATAFVKYQPTDKLNLNLFWVYSGSRKRFNKQANGRYGNGEGPVDAYDLINLNASYEFSKHIRAAVGIENVLNKTYFNTVNLFSGQDLEYTRGNGSRFSLNLYYNF